MGLKLRRLAATLLSSPPASAADAHHAVMRATAHHPFSARLLELLLLLPDVPHDAADAEYLIVLPNRHLIAELAAFASVADAVRQAPPPSSAPQHNALVWELIRLAEEDRVTAEHNIAARVQEMSERLATLSLADAVELVCVLKQVEESASSPADWKWAGLDEDVVGKARRLRERAEEVVLRRTEQERRLVRRGAAGSVSVRVRTGGVAEAVRFGSTRWAGTVPAWR
uniref:Uncharacterized protein n=1 Tax=Oryza brachyantha TaxID=4533 RepID=J3MYB4_ORYBR